MLIKTKTGRKYKIKNFLQVHSIRYTLCIVEVLKHIIVAVYNLIFSLFQSFKVTMLHRYRATSEVQLGIISFVYFNTLILCLTRFRSEVLSLP